MNPTQDEVLATMRRQRDAAAAKIVEAQAEFDRWDGAIKALAGVPPKAETSVTDITYQSAVEFTRKHSDNGKTQVVFDFKNLLETAATLFTSDMPRVKKGIYSAVASLTKQNRFKLAPGGHQLTNP